MDTAEPRPTTHARHAACPTCGYDLYASGGNRCPECGTTTLVRCAALVDVPAGHLQRFMAIALVQAAWYVLWELAVELESSPSDQFFAWPAFALTVLQCATFALVAPARRERWVWLGLAAYGFLVLTGRIIRGYEAENVLLSTAALFKLRDATFVLYALLCQRARMRGAGWLIVIVMAANTTHSLLGTYWNAMLVGSYPGLLPFLTPGWLLLIPPLTVAYVILKTLHNQAVFTDRNAAADQREQQRR